MSTQDWTALAAVAGFLVAIATGLLAGATYWMAKKTRDEATATLTLADHAKAQLQRTDRQLELTTEALNATVLPLLVDVPPSENPGDDVVVFAAPGRRGYPIRGDTVYRRSDPPYYCSVPLRNVGAGVAVIQVAWTEPELPGAIEIPGLIVQPGERVRINITLPDHALLDDAVRSAWDGSFFVAVMYVDARGGQMMITRAHVGTYATSGTKLRGISATRAGDEKPFLEAGRMDNP
jgi:hypothetical protein